MAFAKSSAAYKNGLDKKYDGDSDRAHQSWQPNVKMRPWTTIRKRRIFFAILVMGLLYLFFKNMPTDLPSVGNRIDPLTGLSQGRLPSPVRSNSQNNGLDTGTAGQTYDGPVKFPELANTLRFSSQGNTAGGKENVVFVLHDLHSAASLTALACEMGIHNRSNVHMVLVCPQENTLTQILEVTGINQQNCPISWHDARPDHNSQSALTRRIKAIQIAIGHVQNYIKTVAFVIDEQQAKNSYFRDALKSRLDLAWIPLAIVPTNALNSMNWITTLDGRGLSLVNQIQIDIMITPYRSSSGSLIRLLRSIQSAQYHDLPLPRITVEIPYDIDSFALEYLEYFRWPSEVPTSPNRLTLRKRLKRSTFSPSLASLRTLESFYPQSYPLSHVLVLDPDVELSPDYFSYLYYLTLDYKYSSKAQNVTTALMGISLDLPPAAPTELQKNTPLLLSQSPTSSATLYFGDKWVELQNYLSLRLQHDPDLSKTTSSSKATKDDPKQSSNYLSQAAWLNPATELMRARNYYMLHPTFEGAQNTRLITTHTESHQTAEDQFTLPKPAISNDNTDHDHGHIPAPLSESTILAEEGLYSPPPSSKSSPPSNHHARPTLSSNFLSSLLRNKNKNSEHDHTGLPTLETIPMYGHTGTQIPWTDSIVASEKYAEQVSLQLGGCKSLDDRDEKKEGVDALFCGVDE